MMEKDITKFSNPKIVQQLATKLIGKDAEIDVSTRKDKKYMIKDPVSQKNIHFGALMEDYTKNKNNEKKTKFLNRNAKWKDRPMYSPAWLSYHLLW